MQRTDEIRIVAKVVVEIDQAHYVRQADEQVEKIDHGQVGQKFERRQAFHARPCEHVNAHQVAQRANYQQYRHEYFQ